MTNSSTLATLAARAWRPGTIFKIILIPKLIIFSPDNLTNKNSRNASIFDIYILFNLHKKIVKMLHHFLFIFSGITALNAMTLTSAPSVIVVKVIPIAWRNLVLTSGGPRLRPQAPTRTAIPTGLLLFRDASTVWCMPANAGTPTAGHPAATK